MRLVVAINDRCTISYWARRPIVRSIVATDRTINRDGRRPMVGSIVASCDRSYEHSWHPVAECTISCGTRRLIVDQSLGATIKRTINRSIMRPIVVTYDRSYDQSCDFRSAIIHNWWFHHARLVVRSRKTYLRPLAIWNRRLYVLNMTIDLVTTHFALTVTHDLCYQSYVLSTTCPRFSHFTVAGRS